MRKMSKKAWLVIGVVAVLCISGGVIYAATYEGSFKTTVGGIGMDTDPLTDAKSINGGIRIKGNGIAMNHDSWWPPANAIGWKDGEEIRGYTYSNQVNLILRTDANEDYFSSVHVNASPADNVTATAAQLLTYDDQGVIARVKTNQDGDALVRSELGDCQVKAKSDGDVIITLGD